MTHDDDDHALQEERQAAALRTVADIAAQRAELLRQLENSVVAALRAKAPRRRTQELAEVSTGVFYGWVKAAGLPVRPKKPKGTAARGGESSPNAPSA